MSADLASNPFVVSGIIGGVAVVVASMVSAYEARQARREQRRLEAAKVETLAIVKGNGKGNVSEMLEYVLEDVQYIRRRVDEHIDNREVHVG